MTHVLTETEKTEAIAAGLKAAAQKALAHDPLDVLKLVDMSKITLEPDGTVKGADEAVAELKKEKPHWFGKHARDMTPQEASATLKELKRERPPEPMPADFRHARELSKARHDAWLKEHSRRFG